MKNKLLTIGFTLSATGSFSAATLCLIALNDPLFLPGLSLLFSFVALIAGFVILLIDYENDSVRQQKIYKEVELLIMNYQEQQKKDILDRILINQLLSELEKLEELKKDT